MTEPREFLTTRQVGDLLGLSPASVLRRWPQRRTSGLQDREQLPQVQDERAQRVARGAALPR
jgi:hypothetical protein